MFLKYSFCIWLVDTLIKKESCFTEIVHGWERTSKNNEYHLTERTFNRYRRDAEMLFDIDILCDRKNGNKYYIKDIDNLKNSISLSWLLSAFRISNLSTRIDARSNVVLELAPPNSELLHIILDAIDRLCVVNVTYKSHYKDACSYKVAPTFVRLFKQRWYMICENIETHHPMTLALERILDIKIDTISQYQMTKKTRQLLSSQHYFDDCYGIINKYQPIKIQFRAFWPQNAYISDVPIHSSQKVILDVKGEYTDFEIYVRPTYDLKQEFLWHRDKLAIISPEEFRQDMIHVLQATLEGYKTGISNLIDE